MSPQTRHSIQTAAGPQTYLESGSGRPVLLIHAFPLSADLWTPQLGAAPPGWRFIAPDLRGFGGSPGDPSAVSSVDAYAADVLALLDALGIDALPVAGVSMGGYIAFALFRSSPGRIASLVLSDTRAGADSADGRAARERMRALLASEGAAGVAGEMLPGLLGETTRSSRPEIVARIRQMIERNGAAAIDAALVAMMNRPDSSGLLGQIGVPALVVVGAEDRLTPVGEAEIIARGISGARLVVLPGAGHLPNVEVADHFNHELVDFLTSRAA